MPNDWTPLKTKENNKDKRKRLMLDSRVVVSSLL
jgi:hypothetical protein